MLALSDSVVSHLRWYPTTRTRGGIPRCGPSCGSESGGISPLPQPRGRMPRKAASNRNLKAQPRLQIWRWNHRVHVSLDTQCGRIPKIPVSAAKKVVLRPRIFARRTHWEGRGASRARSPGKTAADKKDIMTHELSHIRNFSITVKYNHFIIYSVSNHS